MDKKIVVDKKVEAETVAVVEQPIKQPDFNPDNTQIIGIACFIVAALILGSIFVYKKYRKGK
jgi:hypothetical protein